MKNKILLSLMAFLLLASISFVGCDNNATGQDESDRVDFIQNVISGSLVASTQQGDFVLQVELSPITTYFTENPGFEAGIISTEIFFEMFTDIFSGKSPNSVLVLRDNGSAQSVPVSLSNPSYNPQTGVAVFTATSLEFTPVSMSLDQPLLAISIDDLESPFEEAFLFFDSGSIGFAGGECGDGAGMVCPIGGPGEGSPCINTGPSGPECCFLGGGVACSDCKF